MQPIRTIWTILVQDLPGTIPVEFGQIPISGLRKVFLKISLYNSMLIVTPSSGVNFDSSGIIWTTLVEDL